MTLLSPPLICVVTPGRGPSRTVLDAIAAAAHAGADLVQVREPALADRDLLALVRQVMSATRGTDTHVVVNDRADVALASGAAGVHLRGNSMPASRVRAAFPDSWIIGRSVHTLDEARRAEQGGGCDYLVFGTVFQSTSKPVGHVAAGIDALAEVCRSVKLPVMGIGGVTLARAGDVAGAGAAGIAAIALFADPVTAADSVIAVRRVFDSRS